MKKSILLFCLLTAFCAAALAQDGGGNVVLEKGAEFSAALQTAINAEKAKIADDVKFETTADVKGLDKGTEIIGRVVRAEKISGENKTSKIGVLLDFIKDGDDFMPVDAVIVSVEGDKEGIKFEQSPVYGGGTLMTLDGKNINLKKGTILRFKLEKDLVEK